MIISVISLLIYSVSAAVECMPTVVREKAIRIWDPELKKCRSCSWKGHRIVDAHGGLIVPTQALIEAVASQDVACMDLLLTSGLTHPDAVFMKSGQQSFLLSLASERNLLVSVKTLISFKADINKRVVQGKNGNASALAMALSHGSLLSMQVLIAAGACACTQPPPLQAGFSSNVKLAKRYAAIATLRHAELTSSSEPGFYLQEGEQCREMRRCDPGYFCPGFGMNTRKRLPCPPGTYNDKADSTSSAACLPCPALRPDSLPGSDSLLDCHARALSPTLPTFLPPVSPTISLTL